MTGPRRDVLPVPSEIVENPQALLKTNLSDSEKLKILEKSEVHAQQMMDAAGEGMTGNDLPTLEEVDHSIGELRAKVALADFFCWKSLSAKANQIVEGFGWQPFK